MREMMRVRVLFFSVLRDLTGVEELEVEVEQEAEKCKAEDKANSHKTEEGKLGGWVRVLGGGGFSMHPPLAQPLGQPGPVQQGLKVREP